MSTASLLFAPSFARSLRRTTSTTNCSASASIVGALPTPLPRTRRLRSSPPAYFRNVCSGTPTSAQNLGIVMLSSASQRPLLASYSSTAFVSLSSDSPFDQFVRVALAFVAAGLAAGGCGGVDSSAVKFVVVGRALDGAVGRGDGVSGAGDKVAGSSCSPGFNSSAAAGRPRFALRLPFGRPGPRCGGAGLLKNCDIERWPASCACCGVNIALGGIRRARQRREGASPRARRPTCLVESEISFLFFYAEGLHD